MPRRRAVSRFALVCVAALAAALAGCSNSAQMFEGNKDGGWFSKPVDVFAKPDWAVFSSEAKNVRLNPSGPVGPEDMVGSDGRCGSAVVEASQPAPAAAQVPAAAPADRQVGSLAGDLAGAPMPAAAPADANPNVPMQNLQPSEPQIVGGIALGMTECDAVRRAGVPGNVSIGNDEKGERKVVLTYLTGSWPGIYSFNSGRLKEISRAPEPPAPPKAPPKKNKSKKPAKPKTAASPAVRQFN